MAVPIVRIIFGILLLFFGHRLFWLLAAIVGFLFGLQLAAELGGTWPGWLQLLVSIGLGLVMAILAVVSVRIAAMIVGFLVGWIVIGEALAILGLHLGTINWVLLVLGGIVGAVLALMVFDLGLVVLTALAGATTIVGALAVITATSPRNPALILLGIVLALIGIIFQWRNLEREGSRV